MIVPRYIDSKKNMFEYPKFYPSVPKEKKNCKRALARQLVTGCADAELPGHGINKTGSRPYLVVYMTKRRSVFRGWLQDS